MVRRIEFPHQSGVVFFLFVQIGAFFARGRPPHEAVVGEGGPGLGFGELGVEGGGGVVVGFLGVFEGGVGRGVGLVGVSGGDWGVGAWEAAEFSAEDAVASEVSLGGFYFGAFLVFYFWPGFFFGLLAVGGGNGDEGIVKMVFQGEDVVGRVGYPAVTHAIISEVGIRRLISRPLGEGWHVMNSHGEEGTKSSGKGFER